MAPLREITTNFIPESHQIANSDMGSAAAEFELSLTSSSQLDLVDRLRDLGIEGLALPQMVVVGDQSRSVVAVSHKHKRANYLPAVRAPSSKPFLASHSPATVDFAHDLQLKSP